MRWVNCDREACTALLCYSYAKQTIAVLFPNVKTIYVTLFLCSVIADLGSAKVIIYFARKQF